jgi:hypothetical protein
MLQPGDRFGDGFSLRHVHQSDARRAKRALQGAAIQLWKHRHIDFACDQCINRVDVIQIHEMGRSIECISRF